MSNRQSTPEQRLESWRAVLRNEGPAWLAELAPRIIAELETEVAVQGMEARRGGDLERLRASADAADKGFGESLKGLSRAERRERLSRAPSSDDSPVPEGNAP